MSYAKTEKGRDALALRGLLTRQERQLLILSDGKRTRAELARMMGMEILEVIDRLEEIGLLMRVSPMLREVAEFSDTGTIEFSLTRPPQKADTATNWP